MRLSNQSGLIFGSPYRTKKLVSRQPPPSDGMRLHVNCIRKLSHTVNTRKSGSFTCILPIHVRNTDITITITALRVRICNPIKTTRSAASIATPDTHRKLYRQMHRAAWVTWFRLNIQEQGIRLSLTKREASRAINGTSAHYPHVWYHWYVLLYMYL